MSFSTTSILEALRDLIAADTDLLSWCQSTYSSNPVVYLGVDEDSPAAESEYPVIGIVSISRKGSLAANTVTWEVDIGCGVIQSTITTSGIKKTYEGLAESSYLMELIERAIIKSKQFRIVDFEGVSGAIVDYPAFVAYSTVTLAVHPSSRIPRFR